MAIEAVRALLPLIEQSAPAQASQRGPIPLSTPATPLIEDFESSFDPEDLEPERPLRGAADRVLGNAAGIRIADLIDRTWRIYIKHVWSCIGVFVVLSIAVAAAGASTAAAIFVLNQVTVSDDESARVMAAAVYFVLFSMLVWLHVGFLTFMLNVARGETAGIPDLFSAGFAWLQALAISTLQAGLIAASYFSATYLSSPILYVPGVLCALLLEPAKLVLIDQDRGIIDAAQFAARLTLTNILPLAALFPIAVLGLAATCTVTFGVGAPVFVPFFTLLHTVTYLRLTDQRTAR